VLFTALKNKEIIMEEQTFNYLVIEDGVVVNRTVGTIDTSFDNWIKQTYPTPIGWKYNSVIGKYIPSDMTTEEFNSIKTNLLSELNEQKTFYVDLVASQHFTNSLTEEKQKEVTSWLEQVNNLITKIENEIGYVIPYTRNMMANETLGNEPFSIRPNIENEV
jgi:hypothetical protein